MNKKTLYVCYASSDYYARETGISMLGFLDNNPDYEPKELFILDYGISPLNKDKLNSIAASYGKRIEYIAAKSILEKIQSDFKIDNFRGSMATYSRAFIDKIIPQYVERLLYIDSDTVVVGSVAELKDFDMGEAVMAGCIAEKFTNEITKGKLQLYTKNEIYITCGIVLFDLHNWRKNDCYSLMSDTLSKKKRYPCADQTLINNTIPQSLLKRLPRKYNYTFHTYNKNQEPFWMALGGSNTDKEIAEAINNPIIIHYAGGPLNRPWYECCRSRRAEDYFRYRKISPWNSDSLYSDKEYKDTIRGVPKKTAHWIQLQKIKRSSFTYTKCIVNIVNLISSCIRRIYGRPAAPSEGKEKFDYIVK